MTDGDASTAAIPWERGRWTNRPVSTEVAEDALRATASEGSDAWRLTSYGFIHASEHALVTDFGPERAMEVSFSADFSAQFDQAGLFLRLDDEHWVKAGVEFADGAPQVGAVVTSERSDWSVAPVPQWSGQPITIRASWSAGALTIRARAGGDPFRLVRLLPLGVRAGAEAGPFLCAPTRPGFTVTFTDWRLTGPDAALH